ncbi:chemotaxis protein [Pleomorphomonas diazotrophica]|uniref:Chemotaxis protein n=1 Tax=Pleomorphomonas diazotrophica TaxID=1166257 RepID=A0A1I4TAD4_9HYPH|nr:globin-coupled sensor protein [Pleomorphomonas diazotrophica]PKR89465.1 chemotaxis protein [Pleomorphomonas diazotrophica]SFM73530.1 Methyl-accepting chemotaxis protein [Pleomorphomonas diazotrophica]
MSAPSINASDMRQRLGFHAIDDSVSATLREHRSYISGILAEGIDAFYRHVSDFPETRRFFRSPDHMTHARAAQLKHWERVLEARFDEAYFQSVSKIGETHYRIGLSPTWYIGGYDFLLNTLIARVNKDYSGGLMKGGREQTRLKLLQALSKAVMVDMDFAISVYIDAERAARHNLIDRVTEEFESSVGAIADKVLSSAKDMATLTRDLDQATDRAAERARSVARGAETASANVATVAAATEELTGSVAEITRQVEESSRVAAEAAADAVRTSTQIRDLSEAAKKIGDVVDLIDNIASQTNLLALNATIEAARAGEAGKGFAVVAAEVKQLADQTAKATSTIADQINGIQSSTEQSVAAINAISDVIGRLSEISKAIAASVEEQGTATLDISRNLNQASTSTAEVTEHIDGVSQANTAAVTATERMKSGTVELDESCARLRSEIRGFLAKVRAA